MRKSGFYGVIIFLLSMLIIPLNTFAENSLEAKVQYGIQNKVQVGKSFPINIQLINHSNETMKGDFVIFSNPTYNMTGSYVIPVSISSGETKEIDIVIKGMYEHNLNNSIFSFYEGGVKKGKEIKLTGNIGSTPSTLPPERIITGILSNDATKVDYFKLMRLQGESIELFKVDETQLSNDHKGLEMLDLIIVNNYDLQRFSEEQRNAIREWVYQGGTLFFDTNMNVVNSMQGLEDFLLLTPSSTSELKSPKQMPSNLKVFNGTVLDDKVSVITSENEIPITLTKQFGRGSVIQFSTSFSNDKMTEWKESSEYFRGVLTRYISSKNNDIKYGYNIEEEFTSSLSYIGDIYPGNVISVPLLIFGFALYLLLITPVLYFILKRKNKREHAWWLVPTIAVVTSLLIFTVGAKDRLKGTQINESSILLLDGDKASGYGVVSFLSNSGGQYEIENKHVDLFPVSRTYRGDSDIARKYAYLHVGGKSNSVEFNDVEYWSIRSAVGPVSGIQLGTFSSKLEINDGKLEGVVLNNLPIKMNDAYILTGRHVYEIGSLASGEEKNLSFSIGNQSASHILPPNYSALNNLFPNFANREYGTRLQKSELEDFKRYRLLELLIVRKGMTHNFNSPVIIGYTTVPLYDTKVNGKESGKSALHLIAIPIQITNKVGGSFSLTEESLITNIDIVENKDGFIYFDGLHEEDKTAFVGKGSYSITYEIPEAIKKETTNFSLLNITVSERNKGLRFSIVNQNSNELVELEAASVTIDKDISDYIRSSNKVEIIVENSSQEDRELFLPRIKLEGELKHD
ncbi:hypothetical protein [Bacillus alkalisoli]|uniref:hypothetical protein n=1 Tax=Bacillus alkalisoli TaxID=2011008 RepID=UPI000C234446|nr:hypothetical protein [Bacillus alkalisoli]